jgi:hypothetical protein
MYSKLQSIGYFYYTTAKTKFRLNMCMLLEMKYKHTEPRGQGMRFLATVEGQANSVISALIGSVTAITVSSRLVILVPRWYRILT